MIVSNTHCKKEQGMAGEGGHTEVGQHFPRTNILVVTLGDKDNTTNTGMRLRKGHAWTIGRDKDRPRHLKNADPFPERSVHNN